MPFNDIIIIEKEKKGVVIMKAKLIKRLHQIILEIAKADDKQLDKIGVELAEIEKALIQYNANLSSK